MPPLHALPSRVADAPVDQTKHEGRRDDKYPENSAISIIRAPNTPVPRPPVLGFPDLPEGAVWKQGLVTQGHHRGTPNQADRARTPVPETPVFGFTGESLASKVQPAQTQSRV